MESWSSVHYLALVSFLLLRYIPTVSGSHSSTDHIQFKNWGCQQWQKVACVPPPSCCADPHGWILRDSTYTVGSWTLEHLTWIIFFKREGFKTFFKFCKTFVSSLDWYNTSVVLFNIRTVLHCPWAGYLLHKKRKSIHHSILEKVAVPFHII